jgi:type I restriction enzyme M protein
VSQKQRSSKQPVTTAERLGNVIKSCRKIMRKDKGLNGDLDRLPMLTWVMFLKFLDDMEQIEESRAKVRQERFRPAIEPPYRWRDWAAQENGITGPELLAFISQDEATRPDGTKGPGLLAYLRSLQNGKGSRRRVIASVFKDLSNRMQSGYLLRDIINQVSSIHFLAQDELFTLGHLYESMLREMRDAAGDSGEFYTPRPAVRFMVNALDPQLGETILDPACGTGGFLVEAFRHLSEQAKTVEQRKVLQEKSIFGGEAKSLPYLLCQMNLLLHGCESPQIDDGNSLAVSLLEIGDRDRVDIILTNPPFGGEEEEKVLHNFPKDMQTTETALLFLQLILRKLRRGVAGAKPGRGSVVVPNGILFGDGIAARVKKELLTGFNLHTIVRLPQGVFEPYTPIPTNLLFFDRSGPTETIWYYELPLPEGRKKYTKTAPLQYEEMADLLKWFRSGRRKENDHAWKVDFAAKYTAAEAAARPHWDAAEAGRQRAGELEAKAKEIQQEISGLRNGLYRDRIDALEAKRKALADEVERERRSARDKQAEGDALYWPVFNLDIKNPRAAEALTQLPPEQLAQSIAEKTRRIGEIMEEVQAILAEPVEAQEAAR